MTCKYSIIIPSYNSEKYLPAVVESILTQDYSDYELIISDDHSNQETQAYLEQFSKEKNVSVIGPDERLSMTEHWEWALSHASGDWIIFVGQDDGLQPYFFQLADRLTKQALEKNIRLIMSQRAYFFWPGCEPVYGDIAVNYLAQNKVKVHNIHFEGMKALFGVQAYFELPEMYTTSLFHRSVIEKARIKQKGKVLTCHPQDANLAAIAWSLEKQYLKSYIPLGWVGSSVKSAGMAIFSESDVFGAKNGQTLKSLRADYLSKVSNSKFPYHELAGDFDFGSLEVYFWQALLKTSVLRDRKWNDHLNGKLFKYLFFSRVQQWLWEKKKGSRTHIEQFNAILAVNQCSSYGVKTLAFISSLFAYLFKPARLFNRCLKKMNRDFLTKTIMIHIDRSNHPDLSMSDASEHVSEKISNAFKL